MTPSSSCRMQQPSSVPEMSAPKRYCRPGRGLFFAALLLASWCLGTSASINTAPSLSSLQERLHLNRLSSLRTLKEEADKGLGNSRHLLTDTSDDGLERKRAALAHELPVEKVKWEESGTRQGSESSGSGEEDAGKAEIAEGSRTEVGADDGVAEKSGGEDFKEAGEVETVSPRSRRQACNFSKGR